MYVLIKSSQATNQVNLELKSSVLEINFSLCHCYCNCICLMSFCVLSESNVQCSRSIYSQFIQRYVKSYYICHIRIHVLDLSIHLQNLVHHKTINYTSHLLQTCFFLHVTITLKFLSGTMLSIIHRHPVILGNACWQSPFPPIILTGLVLQTACLTRGILCDVIF